jgi:hypothetical protein
VPISIRTGGQTGVDRAALDFAIAAGVGYGGWCARGGGAEDFLNAPGLLPKYTRLVETPSELAHQRTAWNVRDSHATLLIGRGDELRRSAGTQFGKLLAEVVYLRPCFIADLSQWPSERAVLDRAVEWLAATIAACQTSEFWLNIGGPRESNARGIYAVTGGFLKALFASSALEQHWR